MLFFVLVLPKNVYAKEYENVELSLDSSYIGAFPGSDTKVYTFNLGVPSPGRLRITLKTNTSNLKYQFVASTHNHTIGITEVMRNHYHEEVDELLYWNKDTVYDMTNEYVEKGGYQVFLSTAAVSGPAQASWLDLTTMEIFR